MKLIESTIYSDSPIYGWYVYLLKFRKRSVLELGVEEQSSRTIPSILLQIGPDAVLYLSIGLIKFNVSLTIGGTHYEW